MINNRINYFLKFQNYFLTAINSFILYPHQQILNEVDLTAYKPISRFAHKKDYSLSL